MLKPTFLRVLIALLPVAVLMVACQEPAPPAPPTAPSQEQAQQPTSPTPPPSPTPTATPTPTPSPQSAQGIVRATPTPVYSAQEESLLRRATAAHDAFNQDRWGELYGYLTPSVQQQCTEGQFAALMQTFVKEIPLAFLEASLEDEQGYTEFVEEARLVLKWEVTHVSAQGDEGLVYKDATLSRLGKTVSSMEPEEPDGWKLIDGQWRWESDESRSS